MENLLTIKEKIKNVNYTLQKIDKDGLNLIEKDILLQELRGLYILVNNLDVIGQDTVKLVDEIQKIDPPTVQNEQKTIVADTTDNIVEFLDSSPLEDEPKKLEVVETPVKIVDDIPAEPKLVKSEPAQQNLFENNRQAPVVTVGEQLGQLGQNKPSLNESLSTGANTNDISSKLGQKPISDIKAAIGIGDRFLYIRELFNGNNDEFEENIIHLNSLISFEEANNYLKGKYNWDYSQETVSNFINVVKRKYL